MTEFTKTYKAIIREGRTGNAQPLIRESESKKQLAEDIRGNGFRVVAILTEDQVKRMKNTSEDKYYEKLHWRNRQHNMDIYYMVGQLF